MRRRRGAAAAAPTDPGGPADGAEGRETVPVEALDRTGPDPAFLDDLDDLAADGDAASAGPAGGAGGDGPIGPPGAGGYAGDAPAIGGAGAAVPVADSPVRRPTIEPVGGEDAVPDAPALDPAAGTAAEAEPAREVEPVDELDFAELRGDAGEGDAIVRADVWATAVFAVVAAVAAVFPDAFVAPFVVVSLVLFAVGCVTFVWGFAKGVGRSREEVVSLGGLFFLGGDVAPARVRRSFQVLLALQVVASVAAAVARPFTPLAFGVLVPTLGIGLMALWGARHGMFADRPDEP